MLSDAENVILAAGAFPKKGGEARRILDSAERVVCCDSAADAFRRNCEREPFAVVGDCDSVKGRFGNVVRVEEQDTNDLAKAVGFCREKGIGNLVILGATGITVSAIFSGRSISPSTWLRITVGLPFLRELKPTGLSRARECRFSPLIRKRK